ncbi:hypothetical protein [Oryza sativa Japonica Group]|uniref:Uncharacterized protein n=1 Tax=Oryza sativa subsp. japonica TaxID=39947 RepID=Q9ASN0_ORYSJ|nr:hypothetical protein [Oryza sativa Japonica Group]BAD22149.1 hypothetical protein [Oryza sativa Japonica Group]
MKMKKIVDDDKRNRHDEDDDVGDPANSSVATNDNDKDAHQHLHTVVDASLGGELMLLPNSSKPKYLKLLK